MRTRKVESGSTRLLLLLMVGMAFTGEDYTATICNWDNLLLFKINNIVSDFIAYLCIYKGLSRLGMKVSAFLLLLHKHVLFIYKNGFHIQSEDCIETRN